MLDVSRERERPAMLSAVITCYKDEQAIVPMYERLTKVFLGLGVDYEIIFVNDGSPDGSFAVLESLTKRDPQVLAVEHSRNFGSQNAFISGMRLAVGDAVILLDGDLQDPPELIPSFFERWQAGRDVVYGTRNQREGSQLLAVLARAFYRIFRRLSEVAMPLDAGDFALMDRRVVDILLELPETDQFIRGLRAWVGFEQEGVPYRRPERAFGRSTHNFAKNIWWAKKAIFSFSFAPIDLLGYAGAVMAGVSTCAIGWQLVLAALRPDYTLGVSMILSVIAFFGSLNLLAIALIGEYVSKIVDETKRRPRFVRKTILHRGMLVSTNDDIAEFERERRERAKLFRARRTLQAEAP